MHFYSVLNMLGGYAGEEGTSGHRFEPKVWTRLEGELQAAVVRVRNLQPKKAATFTPGMKVSELKKIHEQHQSNASDQLALSQAMIVEKYYRDWLSREGVTADADGNILTPTGQVDTNRVSALAVVYDHDPVLRKAQKVHFAGGKLWSDPQCTNPLSTHEMVTHFSGPGYAAYVMTAKGSMYIGSHIVGHHHHSSLKCGKPVACAGEIKVSGGRIEALTNKSGHYWPDETHLLQVLAMLEKNAVPSTFRLGVIPPPDLRWYMTPTEFAQSRMLDGKPDWELVKLMFYRHHLNDAVLWLNNWRIATLAESPSFAIVDRTTRQLVPHAAVRKWLKSTGRMPAVKTDVRA